MIFLYGKKEKALFLFGPLAGQIHERDYWPPTIEVESPCGEIVHYKRRGKYRGYRLYGPKGLHAATIKQNADLLIAVGDVPEIHD